ncbi:MAG: hypothetical protein ABSC94_15100 [Polyangiaceae bacterium]|jgi:acyl-CoA synthetase (AMP-forming)/AMP-acid ligase II
MPDATVEEGSTADAAGGSKSDQSTHDAAVLDATNGEGPTPDASSEADAGPPELQMCETLDAIWGIQTDAGGCDTETTGACPDRADNWVAGIEDSFGTCALATPPDQASQDSPSDCRVFEIFNATENGGVLTDDEQNDWVQNTLPAFILAFFGCPQVGADAGPLAYGLIPGALSSHVFTTADLTLISSYFSTSVQQAVSGAGGTLTQDQIAAINAQLAYLQTTVSSVDSTQYSYGDTCSDAGTDAAPDAGSDSSPD